MDGGWQGAVSKGGGMVSGWEWLGVDCRAALHPSARIGLGQGRDRARTVAPPSTPPPSPESTRFSGLRVRPNVPTNSAVLSSRESRPTLCHPRPRSALCAAPHCHRLVIGLVVVVCLIVYAFYARRSTDAPRSFSNAPRGSRSSLIGTGGHHLRAH